MMCLLDFPSTPVYLQESIVDVCGVLAEALTNNFGFFLSVLRTTTEYKDVETPLTITIYAHDASQIVVTSLQTFCKKTVCFDKANVSSCTQNNVELQIRRVFCVSHAAQQGAHSMFSNSAESQSQCMTNRLNA